MRWVYGFVQDESQCGRTSWCECMLCGDADFVAGHSRHQPDKCDYMNPLTIDSDAAIKVLSSD